jgi:hypothetical protein
LKRSALRAPWVLVWIAAALPNSAQAVSPADKAKPNWSVVSATARYAPRLSELDPTTGKLKWRSAPAGAVLVEIQALVETKQRRLDPVRFSDIRLAVRAPAGRPADTTLHPILALGSWSNACAFVSTDSLTSERSVKIELKNGATLAFKRPSQSEVEFSTTGARAALCFSFAIPTEETGKLALSLGSARFPVRWTYDFAAGSSPAKRP